MAERGLIFNGRVSRPRDVVGGKAPRGGRPTIFKDAAPERQTAAERKGSGNGGGLGSTPSSPKLFKLGRTGRGVPRPPPEGRGKKRGTRSIFLAIHYSGRQPAMQILEGNRKTSYQRVIAHRAIRNRGTKFSEEKPMINPRGQRPRMKELS